MADDMTGIERLRNAAETVYIDGGCGICYAAPDHDCANGCNAENQTALDAIADQIEREHADELAAAKRDLSDEGRETVERLLSSEASETMDVYDFGESLYKAVMGMPDWPKGTTSHDDFTAVRDRLIELIERGGKQDADAAALREAVEGAPDRVHLPISDAQAEKMARKVEAADWVAEQGGLSVVQDYPRMDEFVVSLANAIGVGDDAVCGDELREAVKAEIDKRLMPPGCEWPRMGDGSQLTEYNAPDGVFAVVLALNGEEFALIDNIPIFDETHCLVVAKTGEPVERPEPEVRGADGKPIREGDTVWCNDGIVGGPIIVVRRNETRTENFICRNETGVHYDCHAGDLTHRPPDTQERIDEDAILAVSDYWGCRGGEQGDCPVKADGMAPPERYGVASCLDAMTLDLLRRQRELDARTTGGASC